MIAPQKWVGFLPTKRKLKPKSGNRFLKNAYALIRGRIGEKLLTGPSFVLTCVKIYCSFRHTIILTNHLASIKEVNGDKSPPNPHTCPPDVMRTCCRGIHSQTKKK